MKPEQQSMVRDAILVDCHEAGRRGWPRDTIADGLRRVRGIDIDDRSIDNQIAALERRGLIDSIPNPVHEGAVRWVISAEGEKYLERENLI